MISPRYMNDRSLYITCAPRGFSGASCRRPSIRASRVSPNRSGWHLGVRPAVWVSRFHTVTSRSAGCIGRSSSASAIVVDRDSRPDCKSFMTAGHAPVSLVSDAMSNSVSSVIASRVGSHWAQPHASKSSVSPRRPASSTAPGMRSASTAARTSAAKSPRPIISTGI